MKKVHARRLLVLANFLDKLPRERFHLGRWVGRDWKGKQDLSCGTTACALGWATTIPEFRKLGARMSRTYDPAPGLVGRPCDPMAVGRKLFGLEWGDHHHLFYPGAYPGQTTTAPHEVAARIRALVADRVTPRAIPNKKGA